MDDGTCATFTNSKDCMHHSASVDRTVNLCKWSDGVDEVTGGGSCAYNDPSFDLKVRAPTAIMTVFLRSDIICVCSDNDSGIGAGGHTDCSNQPGGGLLIRGHFVGSHRERRKDARNKTEAH
jgi:hypothetical protein